MWLALVLHLTACSQLNISPTAIDADRDGVRDKIDQCDGTPTDTPVDKNGCTLFNRILSGVDFAVGEHAVDTKARKALDELVMQLGMHPDVRIKVEAHTDNRGNARDNLALSKRRVMSVVRYLVLNGVDGRRLEPSGLGESRPLVGNATEEGRRQNRRIEISAADPPETAE